MANGDDPECVNCIFYFRKKLADDPIPNLFKKIPQTILCDLHKVYIPYERTNKLFVICPFWKHYRSGKDLSLSFSHPLGFFLKKMSLYVYSSMYSGDYKKFLKLATFKNYQNEMSN